MKRSTLWYASVGALIAVVALAPGAGATPLPIWNKVINKPGRFKVLKDFKGEAVLDQETGLVWEQAPDSESDPADRQSWSTAQFFCNNRTVGGRKGWRLPTVQELTSLVDPDNPTGNLDLPPGHPFSNVQSSFYWSATTSADELTTAWDVGFNGGFAFRGLKDGTRFVWCVRGGHGGPDAQ